VIRVLVAEDSATARALIVQILAADPEIEVVGEAVDGIQAVELTQRLHPDLVTMDIHMPRLDGLAATKEIMITAPTPIIIITGSTRAGEVRDSLDILRIGALDVRLKPSGPAAPDFEEAARGLVAIVKAMAQVKVVRHWRTSVPAPRVAVAPRPARTHEERGRVLAIATSTGGPAALQCLLSGLPGKFPLPILVVQHITAGFTEGLASWLASVCPFPVSVVRKRTPLAPGTVYLAPDDRHLGTADRTHVMLAADPPVGGFRPSATVLFESVARDFGASTLAVILTGMGEDGIVGLRAVAAAGGRIIAQDESTSIVFGMPGAAVAAGLARIVLPLDAIAPYLLKHI
jgi:two-component system, chemotaxis family, protein-glutamate methylesterase/glutaminase